MVGVRPPRRDDDGGQPGSIAELAPAGTIDADEIGVAKGAGGGRPVDLPPAPQVAPGKAQEHGTPPGLRAFALEGEVEFLDRVGGPMKRAGVGHNAGSVAPASANPFARNRHESHSPHGRPAGVGS